MENKLKSGSCEAMEKEKIAVDSNEDGSLVFNVKGVEFKMIRVEGGEFMMGATAEQGDDAYDNEKPAHKVSLDSYYIGETQVTQALWEAVMGNNPSKFRGQDKPVDSVSWTNCQDFLILLKYLTGKEFRLPTEAEWEYAARGGNCSRGYKYAGSNNLSDVAWYFGNSGWQTYSGHPVAQKKPNELGIYDMSDSIWEWCNDWFGDYSNFPRRKKLSLKNLKRWCNDWFRDYSNLPQYNPQGARFGYSRVLRGGHWNFIDRYCRVSTRIKLDPSDRNDLSGMCLALSLTD
ncbi:MAG: formylglycine-generating enzyme family protein [Paludibacteraceae bacterium]|nr:formylglycine-generating enzyme family protein [Paludibacteraceae bacterium]